MDCVRHWVLMKTNVRTFLREFAAFKARARRGETVMIEDREGRFHFTAVGARKTLLGSGRGKLTIKGDIVGPTLKNSAWKPSL